MGKRYAGESLAPFSVGESWSGCGRPFMFFASFATANQQHEGKTAGDNMGGAASTGANTTLDDYNAALACVTPSTRARAPSGATAMNLMADFEAFTLDDSVSCLFCSKRVYADELPSVTNVREKLAAQPFMYQGQPFCSLDCFFEHYTKKPGLCMWVDSLFSLAVRHREIMEESESHTHK